MLYYFLIKTRRIDACPFSGIFSWQGLHLHFGLGSTLAVQETGGCDEDGVADVPIAHSWVFSGKKNLSLEVISDVKKDSFFKFDLLNFFFVVVVVVVWMGRSTSKSSHSHHHHHTSKHSHSKRKHRSERTSRSKTREAKSCSSSSSNSHSQLRSQSPSPTQKQQQEHHPPSPPPAASKETPGTRSPTPDFDGPTLEVLQRTSGEQKHFTTTYLDNGEERTLVELPVDEMAAVVGEENVTLKKIMRMTKTEIKYDRVHSALEVRGPEAEVKRAKKYMFYRRAEKRNEVRLQERDDDGDLTVIDIPQECAGFVSGTKGFNMREIELETETFIYYGIDERRPKLPESMMTTIIFGERLNRRRAELRVMALVEIKLSGYYSERFRPRLEPPNVDWGTDIIDITDNFKILLGKKGSTKRKLARAAKCALEYIGTYAYISGNYDQRLRGRTYLQALIDQITFHKVEIPDLDQRDDITVITIPTSSVGYVTGKGGNALREIEDKTDTFCFMEGSTDSKMCRVFICGANATDREEAIHIIEGINKVKLEIDERIAKKRDRGQFVRTNTDPQPPAAKKAKSSHSEHKLKHKHKHVHHKHRSQSTRKHEKSKHSHSKHKTKSTKKDSKDSKEKDKKRSHRHHHHHKHKSKDTKESKSKETEQKKKAKKEAKPARTSSRHSKHSKHSHKTPKKKSTRRSSSGSGSSQSSCSGSYSGSTSSYSGSTSGSSYSRSRSCSYTGSSSYSSNSNSASSVSGSGSGSGSVSSYSS